MYFAIAVVTLAVVLIFNIFCSGYLQTWYGYWGLAGTELGYALIALVGAAAMITAARRTQTDGVDGIEIFSTRPPRLKAVFGGLLLISASYLAAALYSNILNFLMPEMMDRTVEGLQKTLFQMNLPTMLMVVAVFPAVCEEMVFRGVLQYALDRHGSARVAVLLTGVIFGLFHLDLVRIPIAAVTGIALSYALYRTRSIIVPMLMHFVNNAASTVLSYMAQGMEDMAETQAAQQMETLAQAGIPEKLIFAVSGVELTVMVIALLIAAFALLEERPTESLKRHWVTAVVLGCIVLALGAGYITLAMIKL